MSRSFLSRSFCSRALPAFWPDELQWQALQQQTSESLRALADVRSDNAILRCKAFGALRHCPGCPWSCTYLRADMIHI